MNPLSSYLGGTSNQSSMSPMGRSLGFGGDQLAQQVVNETDEERKKRLQEMQQRGLFNPMTSSLLQSYGSM
jgi:hypothetical protein